MGDVYLAHDSRLGRQVALKILPPSVTADSELLRRFETEARAVSKLNHPNVITIHEVNEQDGVTYIATEFIEGQTLRESLLGENLSLADVLDIGIQISSALIAAHAAGVVHRDIKPENIMRRSDGLVKLLDFGIAKPIGPFLANDFPDSSQTEVGVVLGTVAYMSPEQARGLAVDERTDIWSLGVVLYELLSGVQPFTGATRMDTLAAVLEREAKPICEARNDADVLELRLIVDRCLRKDRERRYQTGDALSSELKQLKRDLSPTVLNAKTPLAAVNDSIEHKMRRSAPTLHWLALTGVLIAVLLLITFSFLNRAKRTDTTSDTSGVVTRSYAGMTDAEKLSFVRNQERRISAMMGDRQVTLSEEAVLAIKTQVDNYDSRRFSKSAAPGAESLQEIYGRAVPFVPLLARSFAAQKVPVTIGIYLPMIESEYRPCSESQFGAKGIFQFLPQTARQYGVMSKDMCDVNKMTPAAARYIADRMAELGEDSQSMTLVLLSYNRGPDWVRDKLRELRGTESFQRNFWTLFAHRNELDETFRDENAWYVPRFFAAAIVGENPQAFGLTVPPLSTLAVANENQARR
jgi:serine/threonine protein kinase